MAKSKSRKPSKKRSSEAKALELPQYRKRVIPNKKKDAKNNPPQDD